MNTPWLTDKGLPTQSFMGVDYYISESVGTPGETRLEAFIEIKNEMTDILDKYDSLFVRSRYLQSLGNSSMMWFCGDYSTRREYQDMRAIRDELTGEDVFEYFAYAQDRSWRVWHPSPYMSALARIFIMQFCFLSSGKEVSFDSYMEALGRVISAISERGFTTTDEIELLRESLLRDPWSIMMLDYHSLDDGHFFNHRSVHFNPLDLYRNTNLKKFTGLSVPDMLVQRALAHLASKKDDAVFSRRVRASMVNLILAYHVATREGIEESMRIVAGW